MPLNRIREYILENPTEEIREYSLEDTEKNPKLKLQEETSEYNSEKTRISGSGKEIYIRENVCDIFEMNYSQENGERYKHIIENVKKICRKNVRRLELYRREIKNEKCRFKRVGAKESKNSR